MTVQALGQVTNPFSQVQISNVLPVARDGAAQDAIATGCPPLASAVEPAQKQKVATSQVKMVSPVKPGASGLVKMAANPPAPEGCGGQLDCCA